MVNFTQPTSEECFSPLKKEEVKKLIEGPPRLFDAIVHVDGNFNSECFEQYLEEDGVILSLSDCVDLSKQGIKNFITPNKEPDPKLLRELGELFENRGVDYSYLNRMELKDDDFEERLSYTMLGNPKDALYVYM